MPELKALIFDVDGTIAETEREGHLVAFNQAFADFDLDWHWSSELYKELLSVTGSNERIKHYVHQYQPGFAPEAGLDSFATRLKEHKTGIYSNLITAQPLPLRTGVRRLIREAHDKDIRLAIATTTTLSNVEALLTNSLAPSVMDWFNVVAAGDIVAAKKPAPDIYELVVKQLDLPAENCLAIEDSANGHQSAQAAGIVTLITPGDYCTDHDFAGALLVLDHLGDPGIPCHALSGPQPDRDCVDIALLQRLHQHLEAQPHR